MQGRLFTQDFLLRGIRETPPWEALGDGELACFRAALEGIYGSLRAEITINEAQTEQSVIIKVLDALGWGDDILPQVNLSDKQHEDVPDILLFPEAASKQEALNEGRDDRRYQHGIALLEAKRWLRPLDRSDEGEALDPGAPSSQMLRYLSRADAASNCKIKWGILTNGAVWRLYWQNVCFHSEEFFEIDYLDEVREAKLVLLYRLLFLFYAEDRKLLPVRDEHYAAYSVRRLREYVRDEMDAQKTFSQKINTIWHALENTFLLVDEGDDAIGMPAYNGGLFERARSPLLERARLPDAVMAPILDALSRRTEDLLHAWINYRDL